MLSAYPKSRKLSIVSTCFNPNALIPRVADRKKIKKGNIEIFKP